MSQLLDNYSKIEIWSQYVKPSWRNLWRYERSREDSEGEAPPITHQWTYRDFDRDYKVAYPYGIAQLVIVVRWLKASSHKFIYYFRDKSEARDRQIRTNGFNEGYNQALEIAKERIKEAQLEAFANGRNFEFRTINEHMEGMFKAKMSENVAWVVNRFRETQKPLNDLAVDSVHPKV